MSQSADALMGIFGMKRVKTRKCILKDCRKPFQPRSMTHKTCSQPCAEMFVKLERAKDILKEARKQAKAALEDRRQHKEKVKALKPLQYFEKKAEKEFNKYVRLRDLSRGFGCISCDKPNGWGGQWHASHFKSVGANSFLRYHLWNVHLACSQCNDRLSGNIGEYTLRLPDRIGQERFEYLKTAPRSKKYDREYLQRLAKVFRKKWQKIESRMRQSCII